MSDERDKKDGKTKPQETKAPDKAADKKRIFTVEDIDKLHGLDENVLDDRWIVAGGGSGGDGGGGGGSGSGDGGPGGGPDPGPK